MRLLDLAPAPFYHTKSPTAAEGFEKSNAVIRTYDRRCRCGFERTARWWSFQLQAAQQQGPGLELKAEKAMESVRGRMALSLD